jgi:lipoate-protein ligase A
MGSFHWFPFTLADGAHNMAADEVLVHTAAAKGRAALRFYGWWQPTLSLGYFQPAALRQRHARLARLSWVRRPSGGKALVHHHELTYALALPPGFSRDWMRRMHERVIMPALSRLGLAGAVEVVKEPRLLGELLCFQQQIMGDLVCGGKKIVGSAQRKHRQCLLQHGAILLAQSDHALDLPGIKELTGIDLFVPDLQVAIRDELQRHTGWEMLEGKWSAEEEDRVETMALQYGSVEWNEKR